MERLEEVVGFIQRSWSERGKAAVLVVWTYLKNEGREVNETYIERMWRVTGGEVDKGKGGWMDGVKRCLRVRGLNHSGS